MCIFGLIFLLKTLKNQIENTYFDFFFWFNDILSIYSTLSDVVDRWGVPLKRDFKVKEQILS